MSKIDEKLKEILDHRKEIRELENFLFVLDTCKRSNARQSNIHGVIKVKTTKQVSVFASRWFGLGTHKAEIEIPDCIIEDLEMVLHNKLDGLKKYYELINISHE